MVCRGRVGRSVSHADTHIKRGRGRPVVPNTPCGRLGLRRGPRIVEQLLEIVLVSVNDRFRGIQQQHPALASQDPLFGDEAHRGARCLIYVDAQGDDVAWLRQINQPRRNAASAGDLVLHAVDQDPTFSRRPVASAHDLHGARERRKGVADFMGNAGSELTKRGELFGLHQPILRRTQFIQ